MQRDDGAKLSLKDQKNHQNPGALPSEVDSRQAFCSAPVHSHHMTFAPLAPDSPEFHVVFQGKGNGNGEKHTA